MGKVSKDIASGVSITRVKITIAAGGRPIPRKPLIIPAKKNAPRMISVMPISWEGRSAVVINSFKVVLFYSKFVPVRFDTRAVYTPVPRVIATATISKAQIGLDKYVIKS